MPNHLPLSCSVENALLKDENNSYFKNSYCSSVVRLRFIHSKTEVIQSKILIVTSEMFIQLSDNV